VAGEVDELLATKYSLYPGWSIEAKVVFKSDMIRIEYKNEGRGIDEFFDSMEKCKNKFKYFYDAYKKG